MMSEGKEVVNWKERLAGMAKEVAEQEQPSIVYLSLAGGMMTVLDQQIPGDKMECVILAMGTERTLYDRPYDASDKSPPDCYSQKIGFDDTFKPTMTPADNVPQPRAERCEVCEFSKPKSAPNGRGPACKTRRTLVVAPVSIVDGHPIKQVMIIKVPPTSGKGFSGFVNGCSARGLPPQAMVVEVAYIKSKENLYEMTFKAVRPIEDNAVLTEIFDKASYYDPQLVGGYSYEEAEPETKPTGKKAKF